MYKILLLSHGSLAEEFKKTLKMFVSDEDFVYAIGLKEDGVEKFKEEVKEKLEEVYNSEEGILVLADLYGGTPFNVALTDIKCKYENVEILGGLNLPLLIEAALMRELDVKSAASQLEASKGNYILKAENVEKNEDDE